jgi:hypothetical protein
MIGIDELENAVYEDSNGQLIGGQWQDADTLTLAFECDDWHGSRRRRRFSLRCLQVREAHWNIGTVGGVAFEAEHPLLLDHDGSRAELYFSSKPASVGDVYLAAHIAIDAVVGGWRDRHRYLCHGPRQFAEVLAGGYGMLAQGPYAIVAAVEQAVNRLIAVNRLSHDALRALPKVLVLDRYFVVCSEVDVVEERIEE